MRLILVCAVMIGLLSSSLAVGACDLFKRRGHRDNCAPQSADVSPNAQVGESASPAQKTPTKDPTVDPDPETMEETRARELLINSLAQVPELSGVVIRKVKRSGSTYTLYGTLPDEGQRATLQEKALEILRTSIETMQLQGSAEDVDVSNMEIDQTANLDVEPQSLIYREWTDSANKRQAVAAFLRVENDEIILRRPDGTLCRVLVSSLSGNDQAFIGLASAKLRTWRDSTHKYSAVAVLHALVDGSVKLRKEDGQIRSVPLTWLSKVDQDYVSEQLGSQTIVNDLVVVNH